MNIKPHSIIALVSILLGLSSCSVVGNIAMGDAAREELLLETVEAFHQDLYWGDYRAAALVVKPSYKKGFIKDIGTNPRQQKLVKLEVLNAELVDDGDSAEVEVEMQMYKIPNFVVSTYKANEVWKFRYVGGWFLASASKSEVVDEPSRSRLMDAVENSEDVLSTR